MEHFTKLLVVICYFVVLYVIGVIASRRIADLKDFFVGGKKLGYWVVAFSARATGESAWLLLGLTGMGALLGLKAVWVIVGEVLGVGIAWIVLSPRFKELTDKFGSVTVPDYLESRHEDSRHHVRGIAAFTLVVFPTIYISAQLDATGKAFEGFLGWNYYLGMAVGFLVVLLYLVKGGFVAVAWSDLIQGILMLCGLVFLPLIALYRIGGVDRLWEGLERLPGELTQPLGAQGWELGNIMGILALVAIGLGYLGSPQIFVRFIALRDKQELKKGTLVAILWTFFAGTGAVLIGMTGRVLFDVDGVTGGALQQLMGNDCENVLPMLVNEMLPTVAAGIYIAIVLAAIMSTLDSLLILASSALVRDFYQKILHPEMSDQEMISLCRKLTLVLSTLAFFIALSVSVLHQERTIFWFIVFGWSGIAATFCPVIILSLFWKRLTKQGTIAGMITGFLGVIVFKFWPLWFKNAPEVLTDFSQLGELAPSFLLSMVTAVLVSCATDTRCCETQ